MGEFKFIHNVVNVNIICAPDLQVLNTVRL